VLRRFVTFCFCARYSSEIIKEGVGHVESVGFMRNAFS